MASLPKTLPDTEDHLENARSACEYQLSNICHPGDDSEQQLRTLAASMAKSAGGNFLVLTSYFKAHAGAEWDLATLTRDAGDLTQSVQVIYETFFRRIEDWLDPVERTDVSDALRALLSARGPITQTMACQTFGLRTEQWRTAVSRLRQFLIEGSVRGMGQGETTWRLYHDTFREYLSAKFDADLPSAQARWIRYVSE